MTSVKVPEFSSHVDLSTLSRAKSSSPSSHFTRNRHEQFPPPKKPVVLELLELSLSTISPSLSWVWVPRFLVLKLNSWQAYVVLNSTYCNQGRSCKCSSSCRMSQYPHVSLNHGLVRPHLCTMVQRIFSEIPLNNQPDIILLYANVWHNRRSCQSRVPFLRCFNHISRPMVW